MQAQCPNHAILLPRSQLLCCLAQSCRTKLEGERAVQARWPNHAILRSSIIYGPDPPLVPVERPLLLQFIDECLTAKVGGKGAIWGERVG